MGEWCGSEELEEFGYEYRRLVKPVKKVRLHTGLPSQ
jgi:hypothetical protein